MKDLIDLLCSRDPRSPFFNEEDSKDNSKCLCDNCFYGRHQLACKIITLQAKASMDQELIHHLEEVIQKLTKQNNEKDKIIKLYEQD